LLIRRHGDEDFTLFTQEDMLATLDKILSMLKMAIGALGGVALLVGGVGIANVMIISVLERRSEIGLRRAIGATRRHIATQFVFESASLAGLGGILGIVMGVTVTYLYANQQGWIVEIPTKGLAGGIATALVLGAVAGLYPAARAARLDPAEAIRPT
jgi:putative ABC transport system permease protein